MSLSRLAQFVEALQSIKAVDGLDILIALKQIGLKNKAISCICPELLERYHKLQALDDFVENRGSVLDQIQKRESESDWLKRVAKEVESQKQDDQPSATETDLDKLYRLDPLGIYSNMTAENAERLQSQQMQIWQEVKALMEQIKMSDSDRAAFDSSNITDCFKNIDGLTDPESST